MLYIGNKYRLYKRETNSSPLLPNKESQASRVESTEMDESASQQRDDRISHARTVTDLSAEKAQSRVQVEATFSSCFVSK